MKSTTRVSLSATCLLALAACASGPSKCIQYVECPDGPADCREQAHDLCPGGYHEMSDSDVGSDFGNFAKDHFEGARTGVPHIVVTCD